jgi:hypothetical protein
MSLAGEHLLETADNDREAGIFSTISVPTSISRFEPASTSAKSGTLPFLDGILGDIAPDAVVSEAVGAGRSVVASTLGTSIAGSPTIPGGSTDLSPSTTIPDS